MKIRNILATAVTAGAIAALAVPASAVQASVAAYASSNTSRCNPVFFVSSQACVGATVNGTEIKAIKGRVVVWDVPAGTYHGAVLYPGGTQVTGNFTVRTHASVSRSTPTATINKRWSPGDQVHVYLFRGRTLVRSWNGHVRDLYPSGR